MIDAFAEEKFLPLFFRENQFCQACGLYTKENVNCMQGRGSLKSKVLVLSDKPSAGDIVNG